MQKLQNCDMVPKWSLGVLKLNSLDNTDEAFYQLGIFSQALFAKKIFSVQVQSVYTENKMAANTLWPMRSHNMAFPSADLKKLVWVSCLLVNSWL